MNGPSAIPGVCYPPQPHKARPSSRRGTRRR
jgi:hypothetical protein